jgi:membrane-associated phospholipid phosphatase
VRPVAVAAALLVASLGVSSGAQADDPAAPAIRWDPAWTHANAWDYSLASVGLVTLLTETVLLQNRTEPPRWNGPILFDSAARNVFRLASVDARLDMEPVSWALWFGVVGYPLLVDVPYVWFHYGKQAAWDLFWQDATALSLSGAADFALRDTVDRLRPYNTDCLNRGGTYATCLNGPEATRSFPSGHVSETTTAAALICTQHLMLRPYGGAADEITCGSAAAADLAVTVVRLMGDDHWATDDLAGAALGVVFGWGVPVLMHLHGHAPSGPTAEAMPVLIEPVPMAFPLGAGLGLAGLF